MLPLLPLLLLVAGAAAQSGPPPSTVNYVGDELIRIDFGGGNYSRVTFTCPDSRTTGVRFVRTGAWTPGRTFYGDFAYRRGDIADLRRVRQKLGPYECITDHGRNRTIYAFVLSERIHPRLLERSKQIELQSTGAQARYSGECDVNNGGRIVWEKYNESDGQFVPYSSGLAFTITYDAAEGHQSVGFTIYRCYDESTPENISYYRMMKPKSLSTRQFRTSRYESTVVPHYVKPSLAISLECKGLGLPGSRGVFRFKQKLMDNETYYTEDGNSYTTIWENYVPIRVGTTDWVLQFDIVQSQVQVPRMRPRHAGFYSCVKDKVQQRAVLDVDYGEVIIKGCSKKDCALHSSGNLIECEVTERDLRSLAYFLLRLPGRTLRLDPGTTIEGYKTSIVSTGIQLEFDDKPEAVGARLECSLPYTTDYTRLVKERPKLNLTLVPGTGFLQLFCRKDRPFSGPLHAARLNPDGSIGESLDPAGSTETEYTFYVYPTPSYVQVVCFATHDGSRLLSNIAHYGTPSASLDIVVAGDRNPGPKVFIAGRDIPIVCSFGSLPSNLDPAVGAYSLAKNGAAVPSGVARSRLNLTDVQFLLRRATPADSGDYVCSYARTVSLLRSVPLTGTFRSPTARLAICSSSQFVCDSMCKDRRLLCDKNRDCADGTDERDEYCTKCEPNEIRCKEHRGVSPRKRCVLKHWLCDAQDDCGNGYDEDTTLHRKWCFKEPTCSGCNLNQTCCPGPPNRKCIPRTYECDKEQDCAGGPSEEGKCTKDRDCLRLTSPTARRTIIRRVGEPLELTCVAVGLERPTINWRRNWAALPAAGVEETNRVVSRGFPGDYTVEGKLAFSGVTKAMAGIYNCEAVNNCKRVMSYELELRVLD